MLLELRVENYAVIDNVAVEFGPGLNLLTGETGAGKSLLVDALALLFGEKASADVVRHGTDKAVVAAEFEMAPGVARVLEANGLDSADSLILRREISSKARVFVNNQPATVAVLKQLAPYLGAIHAQSEAIISFDGASRLELLDQFAGNDVSEVREAYEKYGALRARIADLEKNEQDRLRMVDLWSFQKKEIESAKLEPGEDERLAAEKRVLANAEKLHAAATAAYEVLYEAEGSASAALSAAGKNLEELARYDEKFHETGAALGSARVTIEDVAFTLRDYAAGIDASPERLAEIEDRLALLDRLKRKYGASVAEVIAFGEEAARKLNEIEHRDDVLKGLRAEQAAIAKGYLQAARSLSKKRYDAAKRLQKLVENEVNELAMKAKFAVELSGGDEEPNWTATGFDAVQCLIATNVGEPLKPVEEIASGGELSRVLLALKAAVETAAPRKSKEKSEARTLVFDEIDTGIGGSAAEAVGKKLHALARHQQVLCITHLPQIAALADQHYVIEKREAGGRVKTSVRRLTREERTEEIARMLSGAKLTETSRKHAEQMLKANA